MIGAKLLEIKDITKKFGEFYALNNCNLSILGNQITGIIGPNGAGKSTLFNILGGLIKPDGGYVSFHNTKITGLRPDQLVINGVIRTFQISRELGELTVLENMLLADLNNPGDILWKNFIKPAEVKTEEPAAPYKIDPLPAGTEAAVITAANTEAVVVVADAVVPAEVVKAAPAKPKSPAKPKAVKAVVAKAPAAPKKPRAPKAK